MTGSLKGEIKMTNHVAILERTGADTIGASADERYELGDYQDNLEVFQAAIDKLRHGQRGPAFELFRKLQKHIEKTRDTKSVRFLQGPVRDALERYFPDELLLADAMEPYAICEKCG